ncbi:MAG: winged helix-turn-helix domain-containing protein [Chlamydiota bacterium]
MLESLFGNPVIEKILFYLELNEKCYPSQLRANFQTPLYSFQRALQRLEKGGIIISHKEGKTLIYQFNPRYPFLIELKAFLQKAYTFFPKKIKEQYYEPITRKRPRRSGKPL